MADRELDAAEANLLQLEQRVTDVVGNRFAEAFALLWAQLLVFWPGDDAEPAKKRAAIDRLDLASLLASVPRAEADSVKGALEAFEQGSVQAFAQLSIAGVTDSPSTPANLEIFTRKASNIRTAMTEQITKAQAVLNVAETLADGQAALVVAQQGINRARMTAATLVNESHNNAITMVSHQVSDVVSVWRGERDACVMCLSFQGSVDDGQGYAPARAYVKGLPERVHSLPLHPWCRCTQWIVHVDAVGGVATGLRREAERSIARGFSRPSESNAVRIDAARRLLQQGSNLPKSVREYAQRAVKRGQFPRGRTPPL